MLRITDRVKTGEKRISRIVFNGKTLSVYSLNHHVKMIEVPANSGLPPNSNTLRYLIQDKGRTDLNINTDYTLPEYQDTKDAGPIQEDTYFLTLKPSMPYDKSNAQGDGRGWGIGGWILTENVFAKLV